MWEDRLDAIRKSYEIPTNIKTWVFINFHSFLNLNTLFIFDNNEE